MAEAVSGKALRQEQDWLAQELGERTVFLEHHMKRRDMQEVMLEMKEGNRLQEVSLSLEGVWILF